MKSTACAKGILLALVCCAVFAAPAVAQPSLPVETFAVEVDVFSGRPNPVFNLDAADLQLLTPHLRASCTSASVALIPYPDYFLGYRGLTITRAGAASVHLARKGIRFVGSNPPSICQDQMQTAGDLFVADSNSSLEAKLVELAFQKGVIDNVVHQHALDVLSAAK
jgi:hypothetical protein